MRAGERKGRKSTTGRKPQSRIQGKTDEPVMFEMNNKTTLKGERQEELTREIREHGWIIYMPSGQRQKLLKSSNR